MQSKERAPIFQNKFPIPLLIFCLLFACASNQMNYQNCQLKENEERIEIMGTQYLVVIDKATGILNLFSPLQKKYTQFPLTAQFNPSASVVADAYLHWEIREHQLTLEYLRENRAVQKVILEFHEIGFQIKFGIKPPLDEEGGIYCFKNGTQGFDDINWTNYFSPEADDYYVRPPVIDVRASRDNQWIFCPAPLNISVETAAGWFSIGLAELAPITRFGLKNQGIWLDYPWQKLPHVTAEFFWLTPLVFTFNNSEWQSVGDYRRYLEAKNHIPPPKDLSNYPTWWQQPLLSTWGEQSVQNITQKNSGYHSAWVKDYISQQSKIYREIPFTIVIESQWQEQFGDATPSRRFTDLKQLIQWCHQQGHKVILWWKAWTADAQSLAQKMRITDGDFVDATHPNFPTYVKHCCAMMLSNADTALNADGIKLAEIFRVRDPRKATYADCSKGVGLQELYLYLETFYNQARLIKPDALIIGNAQNPHFQDVQDMVCLNEDWDNKLRREKRACIITQALPTMLIEGDAADMSGKIALYHYVTSAIYANPEIEYLTKFHDEAIEPSMQELIAKIIYFYQDKGPGYPVFMDYGWWQWRNKNHLVAESIAKGTALLRYRGKSEATLFSIIDQDVPFILEKKRLLAVKDEKGNKIEFEQIGKAVYKLNNIKHNQFYRLKFRQIPQ